MERQCNKDILKKCKLQLKTVKIDDYQTAAFLINLANVSDGQSKAIQFVDRTQIKSYSPP